MPVIFVPRRTASSALSRAAVQFRCGTIAFAALSRSNGGFVYARPDKAIHSYYLSIVQSQGSSCCCSASAHNYRPHGGV